MADDPRSSLERTSKRQNTVQLGELVVTDESCSATSFSDSPSKHSDAERAVWEADDSRPDRPSRFSENRRFIQFRRIDEIEIDSDYFTSNCLSKENSNKSGSHEQSKSLKSPTGSTKDGNKVKLIISPSIKKYDIKIDSESCSQELPLTFIGEKPFKMESPKGLKRTPTNKHPIKVFSGKDGKLTEYEELAWKKPPISKNPKFVFSGLTIDVEEANKQFAKGNQPMHLIRGESPKQPTPQPLLQKQAEEGKDAIAILKNFYQDQIDRLAVKNEYLLRENERLKMEVSQVNNQSEEIIQLRAKVLELQAKIESQPSSSKDSPFNGFLGELRHNAKAKILLDSKHLDYMKSDKMFNSSEATVKEFPSAQTSPKFHNKLKVESVKCRPDRIDFPVLPDKQPEFGDKSPMSCTKSLREQESLHTVSKKTGVLDDLKKDPKKTTLEYTSLDTKDHQERDANYLKEFICKLKNASEGMPKHLKSQLGSNVHKKTSSLTSAPAKRRDLTGYYVTQKKTKDTGSLIRNPQSGIYKGHPMPADVSEARPSLAGSRSHASSLIKTIEKSFKQQSYAQVAPKDASLTVSYLEEATVVDLAKHKKDKEKKVLLQGLITCGKTSQDYKKAFGGLTKKKNSESCSSVKLAESRLTPQLRPGQHEVFEKSSSDL